MPRGGARPGAGRKRTRALSPAPTGGRQTSMHHFLGSATRAVSSSPDRDARALALPALPSSEPVTPANDSAVVIPPVSSSSRPDVASLPTSSSTLAAQPATNNALLRALEDSTSAALRMATAQGTAVRCLPGTAAAIAQTRDSPVMSSEASSPASSPPSSNSPVHSGVPPMPLLTTGSGSLDRFLRRFGRSGRDGSADHGADANELPFELQASDALLETSDSTDESDDGGITTDEDDEDSGHVDAGPSVQNRSRRISSAMRNHLECIVNDLRRDDSALLAGVKHGQCWVHPPVPCVRENIKDISLDLFYLVPVFIWDVETMFCDLQLKWPRCGHERFNKQIRGRPNVVRKGWTMGRRVVGRDRSYYVVTRRYRCGNCQARGLTPSTFSGHDPELLVSLPSFVRTVFPAFITHRSGIDKSVLDEMRSLVDHGVSIAGFARHLMETHTLRYTRTQIQYFGALQHCLHRFGYAFTKQQAISPQQFSAFDDPNGYDGFVPSASFLEAMYLKYLSEHRPLMDRLQQTVDGRVLKLDHSFKVPKLLRMFGPYPLFSALLTAVNEFEEPTLQRFTYSTSLNEVFVALRGYLLRCLLNGFELASVIVSDRCCQDASAFMEIIWVRKALARRDAFCSSLKRILDQLLSSVSSDTPIHAALSDLNVRVISAARHKAQTMLRIAVEDEDLPIEQSIVKNVVQMMSQTALLVAREVADGYSSNPAAPDDEIIGRVVASIASAIETVSKDTSMDDSSRRGADPFPAFCWPDPDGIVLNNTRAISDFCSAIRNLPIADRVVGFDTESNVTFMKDGARWKSITSPVCTVQIALRGHPPRVLQLLSDCPVGLKMLLEDPTVTKAGLSIEGDLKKLQKDFGVLMTGHVDVAKIGKRCGKIASSKVSLAHLMQRVFGVAMEKDPNIRVSDKWLKTPLPVEFVRYACRDAYACLALYDYFMQFNDCTVPIAPATVACGLRVDVVIGSNGKRLASGSITDLSSGPSGAVCVRLDEIHAPGLRLGSRMGIADIDFNRIERLPVDVVVPIDSLRHESRMLPSAEDNREVVVLKDIWHWLDAIPVKVSHPSHDRFMALMRDAIFMVEHRSVDLVKHRLEQCDLLPPGDFGDFIHRSQWARRRIPRYTRSPVEMDAAIARTVDEFKDISDPVTGQPLLTKEALSQIEVMRKHVRKGCLSDPPGFQFYTQLGFDRLGIPVYHCSRGTNSLEGGVHRELYRCFGSFGASIELGDALVAEKRHRLLMRSSVRHRDDVPFFGHYNILEIEEVQRLSQGVTGRLAYPNWVPLSEYVSSHEQFGVGRLTKRSVEEDCPAPQQLLRGCAAFVAQRLQQTIPVLPVNTERERALFNEAVLALANQSAQAGFSRIADMFNGLANGVDVFRKTDVQLKAYHTKWQAKAVQTSLPAHNRQRLRLTMTRNRVTEDGRTAATPIAVPFPRPEPLPLQSSSAEQRACASGGHAHAPALVPLARRSTLPPSESLLASPTGASPTSPDRSTTGGSVAIMARLVPPVSPVAALAVNGTVHDAMRSGISKPTKNVGQPKKPRAPKNVCGKCKQQSCKGMYNRNWCTGAPDASQ